MSNLIYNVVTIRINGNLGTKVINELNKLFGHSSLVAQAKAQNMSSLTTIPAGFACYFFTEDAPPLIWIDSLNKIWKEVQFELEWTKADNMNKYPVKVEECESCL